MNLGGGNAAVEVALSHNRRGQESGVEHLKCDASRGNGHAGRLTDFTWSPRRSEYAERLAQVFLDRLEIHR